MGDIGDPHGNASFRLKENIRHLPDGRIGIVGDAASIIGLLFWILVAAVLV